MSRWSELLAETRHRPYPLPGGRVYGTMCWHDLLFAHYRVDVAALRAVVPAALELDLHRGDAWLGVVPFYMSHVGLPHCNRVPGLSAFEELNVRTYVKVAGRAGVYFFSLDAACWPAVLGARAGFRLPYFWADMQLRRSGAAIHFESRRRIGPPASFEAHYRPTSEVRCSEAGSLEHWLTERYCLYTLDGSGAALRCDIHHLPWPLQSAEASLERLDMTRAIGLQLQGKPLLHFARRLDVLAWPLSPGAE